MKFIEHSNSVYKSDRKYISPKRKKIRKIILESLIFLFFITIVSGIVYEAAENNKAITSLKSSHNLGSYEDKKITYGVSGGGETTVLFEPDIGKTLLQWNLIIREPIDSVGMFYYDRFGYGGSDVVKDDISVDFQSNVLDKIVTNRGYEGKYILVSEGYGSLIHLDYYKKHKDKVGGIILINPNINLEKKSMKTYFQKLGESISLNIDKFFSVFSITRVLNNIPIFKDELVELYEENVISRNKENYIIRMLSSDYFSTILKEKDSMKEYLNDIENFNFVTTDIPVIVISSNEMQSEEYEKYLKEHFENLEILYFDNTDNFSYTNSEYLRNLISNMSSRIVK